MKQPGKANKNYKQLCKVRSLFIKINNACTKQYSSPEYFILMECTVCSSKENVISHIHTYTHIYTEQTQNRIQNAEKVITYKTHRGK
jgi:hypothetical protein